MRAMEGDPKFEASQDLPNFGYADYAELDPNVRGIMREGFKEKAQDFLPRNR
jgi:hypothetical protein